MFRPTLLFLIHFSAPSALLIFLLLLQMTVVYHELLSRPEATAERLLSACGVDDPDGRARAEALTAMDAHSQNNIFSRDGRWETACVFITFLILAAALSVGLHPK